MFCVNRLVSRVLGVERRDSLSGPGSHQDGLQGNAEFPVLSLLLLFLPLVAVSEREREEGALCQQDKQVFSASNNCI